MGLWGEAWAQAGAVGMFLLSVALFGWAMATGRLISRTVHERAISAEEKRGDSWHAAYSAEVARGDVLGAQLTEILTFVRAATREAP